MDKILDRFGDVQEEYEHLGGYALEAQAREVLHGLGFHDDQIDGDVGALSGGWKMRVALARVLLGRPDVLLMDEPTNHLDIESIIWLEQFLKSFHGALLMTSHDREFMNRIVTKIAEIDAGEIITYSGNYDFYERERAIRETNQQAAFARQQAMLAKEQRFIDRFKTHAAKAAQVQSRIKALDKIEKIELPKKRQVVKFEFRVPPRSGDQVAVIEDLHKSYGPRVIYDGFNLTIRRGERWAVMGRNGAGKTTLLQNDRRARLTPDAGEVRLGASLTMGYFAQQSLDVLDRRPDRHRAVAEGLSRRKDIGSLRTLAGAFQFSGDDVDKKIRALSGGEKSRLAMARMLYNPPNFLVLDEPTNHLDLATKEMLVEALKDFEGTMIFVSHDRTFLRGLGSRVLELGGESGTDRTPHIYPGILRRVRSENRPRSARHLLLTYNLGMRIPITAALFTLSLTAQSFDPKLPAAVPAVTGTVVESAPLRFIEIQEGTGEPARPAQEYTVHYTGWLRDGKKFDSSVDRGTPLKFVQGRRQVIAGWEIGFEGMKVGGKRRLFLPYQLAYGELGNGSIPPKAELIFDVELLAVKDVPKTSGAQITLIPLDDLESRSLQLAKAIPEEKYSWRPAPGVRSVKEVLLHIAFGNERLLNIAMKNPDKEAVMKQIEQNAKGRQLDPVAKEQVIAHLSESFAAVRKAMEGVRSITGLTREIDVFGKQHPWAASSSKSTPTSANTSVSLSPTRE